jgi:hypothetical protein
MFKVTKTNKKTVEYTFNNLEELSEFAKKGKFTKGKVILESNGILIEKVRDAHSLSTWSVTNVLIERGIITE